MNNLSFDSKEEVKKITSFLQKTLTEQKIENVVLGLSGGIDSATCLYLLRKTVEVKHIFATHLPYFQRHDSTLSSMLDETGIPQENRLFLSIQPMVDTIIQTLAIHKNDKIRVGNIMARVRMITLFDLAKKHRALVCGTENRSEHLLGYFTRFGDGASDVEPIMHLYKTQVYDVAKYIKVPDAVMLKAPTAGLWNGQTDEEELGFSYEEADQVLSLYYDKKVSFEKINKQNFPNAEKIITVSLANHFKHKVPYSIK